MTDSDNLLEVRNLTRRFPGVVALSDVNLSLRSGEVLAVIGENGAGKSTLMKILAGMIEPDEGEILLDGAPVRIDSVRRATELGVSLIHQELNLSDNLNVGANIFLGREPSRMGFIRRREIEERSRVLLDRIGLTCSPSTLVSRLSIGHQQMVEIAKALSVNARILIMDEPTSSLSQHETEQLYAVIRDLRKSGVSIIYISHRLGEVKELADRVTVLRDGKNAGELAREEITHDSMVRLMVGRELLQSRDRTPLEPGDVALEVRDLVTPAWPDRSVSFTARAGEIVGLAGLVGAGRTEILQAVFGVEPALSGSISVAGEEVTPSGPVEAIAAGIALVPEDRKGQGLIIEMAVRENLSLASLRRDRRGAFLNRASERTICGGMIDKLSIKTPSAEQVVQYLSGGNQQKVVIGKWLAMKPRVLLLDEPTRGIDIGSKREIYMLMEELARQGVAIVFVSSEMEEILTMSDRALVVHDGRISGELRHDQLTEEAVMQLAVGGGRKSELDQPA